jgi:DNA repair exonuclease SbcCD ATPase subunit
VAANTSRPLNQKAEEKLAQAEAEAESLMESKKREISALATAARREGERIITEATTEVSGYRQWLAGVISEAERLYRIQKQSLDAAESAIQQSRNRLDGAFQRLEELQKSVLDNLNADDTLINLVRLRFLVSAHVRLLMLHERVLRKPPRRQRRKLLQRRALPRKPLSANFN